jgi:hypothetical protein
MRLKFGPKKGKKATNIGSSLDVSLDMVDQEYDVSACHCSHSV